MSSRASSNLRFFSSLIPAISFSKSESSSSSPSSAGAKANSPSVSPSFLALRACLRSSRLIAFSRRSCRICLSVFGIMAKTSSASSPRFFFFPFDIARLLSSSLPSESSSSEEDSSPGTSRSGAVVADSAALPISANKGLLNHLAAFRDFGSLSGNSWMRGFFSFCWFAVFCFFFLWADAAACSSGVIGSSWNPSSSPSSLSLSLSWPSESSPVWLRSFAYALVSASIPSDPANNISWSSWASSASFSRISFFDRLAFFVPTFAALFLVVVKYFSYASSSSCSNR